MITCRDAERIGRAMGYPGYSAAGHSLANNPEKSGVMRVPPLWDVLGEPSDEILKMCYKRYKAKKKKRVYRRVKSVEFRARLTQETAEAVKQKMEELGIASKQTLVEALLLRWVKEKAPTAATAETK